MDIDFPLILVIAVFASGLVWLFDALFLARKRLEEDQAAVEPVIVEYAKSFFPVLLLVLVLRSFLVEPFQIPSSSMEPTLDVGDFILVNKYAYGIRLPVIRNKVIDIDQPERGDVMVFFPPNDSRYFIKRVIGLPGDEIRYVNKQLIINGKPVTQTLLARLPPSRPELELAEEDLFGVKHHIHKFIFRDLGDGSYTVPEGHFFVMGDNRDNSHDSRAWGTVPEENIVGKAFAIWMHWPSFFSIPSFDRVGLIR